VSTQAVQRFTDFGEFFVTRVSQTPLELIVNIMPGHQNSAIFEKIAGGVKSSIVRTAHRTPQTYLTFND
jgi:hypothetical protein